MIWWRKFIHWSYGDKYQPLGSALWWRVRAWFHTLRCPNCAAYVECRQVTYSEIAEKIRTRRTP